MALSRKSRIIIGVVALVVIAIAVGGGLLLTRKDAPVVTVVKVEKKKQMKSTVTASGEVRPIQFINLTSEVQGRIEEIYVKEGDVVTVGQELVRLDPTQIQSNTDAQVAAFQASRDEVSSQQMQITAAQNQLSQTQQGLSASFAAVDTARQRVESARQQIVAAQTEVDRTSVDLRTAQRELSRITELVESGVETRFNYDAAKDRVTQAEVALRNAQSRLKSQQLAVNEANASVTEASARAKQQEAAVHDARRGVESARINAQQSQSRANQQAAVLRGQRTQQDKTLQRAQINGVVADIPSKVGQFAVAGLSTTPLMTIADMSAVNVEVKVDETQIDNVSVGQKVNIKVDAFGEKELVGEVSQKTPLAVGKSQTSGGLSTNINTQESKEFRVVIQLKDLPKEVHDGLRPGMSATAVITTNTVEDSIAVPIQAIIEKKPDASPSPTVAGDSPEAALADKPKTIKGVFVLENNKVKFVEVTTGIRGDAEQVITGGLSEGQEIVTGPSRVLGTLKDDMVVKKEEKKADQAKTS